jgi:hypothetical protein
MRGNQDHITKRQALKLKSIRESTAHFRWLSLDTSSRSPKTVENAYNGSRLREMLRIYATMFQATRAEEGYYEM